MYVRNCDLKKIRKRKVYCLMCKNNKSGKKTNRVVTSTEAAFSDRLFPGSDLSKFVRQPKPKTNAVASAFRRMLQCFTFSPACRTQPVSPPGDILPKEEDLVYVDHGPHLDAFYNDRRLGRLFGVDFELHDSPNSFPDHEVCTPEESEYRSGEWEDGPKADSEVNLILDAPDDRMRRRLSLPPHGEIPVSLLLPDESPKKSLMKRILTRRASLPAEKIVLEPSQEKKTWFRRWSVSTEQPPNATQVLHQIATEWRAQNPPSSSVSSASYLDTSDRDLL
jgi:hypothetical protein